MNTPSHLLINAAIHKKANRADIPRAAFLWGSVAPDIPLVLLSVGTYVYHRFILQESMAGLIGRMFDTLYFEDPLWIAAHNFLHAPFALFAYLAFLWRYRQKTGTPGHWALWFALGCVTHSAIDILTHYDDGPALFWPFEWHTRFYSPVSYWDDGHFGLQFAFFELVLDVALLAYLFVPRLVRAIKKRNSAQ